jgi:hypothetical protein
MTQHALAIKPARRYSHKVVTDPAGVVALDRHEDGEIILRFLVGAERWSAPREVRMNNALAQQLKRLLADELNER